MICPDCSEEILPGEPTMKFNCGKVVMHMDCGLRGVIGSVAHLSKTCSCFVNGSTENDPPGMTKRQAAEAAVKLWRRLEGVK